MGPRGCPQCKTCDYLVKASCRGCLDGWPCLAPKPNLLGVHFAPAGAPPPRSLALEGDAQAQALSLLQPNARLSPNGAAPPRQRRAQSRAVGPGLTSAAATAPYPFPPTASTLSAPQVPQATLSRAPPAPTPAATPTAHQASAHTGSAPAASRVDLEEAALQTAAAARASFDDAAPRRSADGPRVRDVRARTVGSSLAQGAGAGESPRAAVDDHSADSTRRGIRQGRGPPAESQGSACDGDEPARDSEAPVASRLGCRT